MRLGQLIRHVGKGPRHGYEGIVAFVGGPEDRITYGIIWLNAMSNHSCTELVYYTSHWLDYNIVVLREPVRAAAIPAVGKWAAQASGDNSEKFGPYYCAVDGAGAPNKPHGTLTAARTEAERLGKTTGKPVNVYRRVARLECVTKLIKESEWV